MRNHTSGSVKVLVCLEMFRKINSNFSKNLSTPIFFVQKFEMFQKLLELGLLHKKIEFSCKFS